jgi:hypothetical protein
MMRSKPQNYDFIRKQILELCKEPKTLSEITEFLDVNKNIPYRAMTHLIDKHCIKTMNDRGRKRYLTVSTEYTPPVQKSNYKVKEVHTPSPNGRIYTLDKPYNKNEDNYHTRHIAAQRQRDAERSRSRTYVGISTIYNND